tara:strand:- start:1184 stop:2014 length:831 start_codon:yes stop_codon:yes gene_type:complete
MNLKKKKVLKFYKELPFNIYSSHSEMIKAIKTQNPLVAYPVLKKIIKKFEKPNILDIGSGCGWFLNSLNYHTKNINCTGIDFNQRAVDYSNDINKKLNAKNKFIKKDLFKIAFKKKFELITSIGVLHHTENLPKAINHITKFLKKDSFFFLGLYHTYGRKPFLDYFKKMKNKSENYRFLKYKELHKTYSNDDTHLYSWFRDQVLHPHETQHSFKEISKLLIKLGYEIQLTSINKFQKIRNFQEIYELEKKYYNIGMQKLKNLKYFPGFFIILAKKK